MFPFEFPPPEEPPPPEDPEEPPPPEEELAPELVEPPPEEVVPEDVLPEELLDEEELELLEVEDPPPGSPSCVNALWRCVTTVPTAGPRVATATTTARPIAAAINAYSTAAAPAESRNGMF